MILSYYYLDDLSDSDYETLVLYHDKISLKPFWISFDNLDQFISWWNVNKDKIVIVDFFRF